MTVQILHLVDTYRVGGPGNTIINSAKYIDRRYFDIHVGSFVKPSSQGDTDLSIRIRNSGIEHLRLIDKRGIRSAHIRQVLEHIEMHRVRIVHTHGYKTDAIGVLVKLIRSDICIVSTFHGWIENDFLGKINGLSNRLLSFFLDGIILVSNDMRRRLPRLKRIEDRSVVIHNAIVISDYRRQYIRKSTRDRLGVRDQDVLIGVVGRLSLEKGGIDILAALYLLNRENLNAKLLFIGEGPLLGDLKAYTRSRLLNDKVIFAGYQDSVHPFYEAVDILACPSHTEGLSNAILEAMAYELPIVGTRVGGNSEIIDDGVNGLLVEAENPIDMAKALAMLIREPAERTRIGRKGPGILKSRFLFEDRMRKVEKFYLEVLEKC